MPTEPAEITSLLYETYDNPNNQQSALRTFAQTHFAPFFKKYKFALPFVWFFATTFSALVIIVALLISLNSENTASAVGYSIYSAKPYVLGDSTSALTTVDARAATIDAVFAKYNCPLTGHGETFVLHADKNNIPYWLVAAVAFQESSCGKNVPKKDGIVSNNYWGWGVYGDNVKTFDTVEHGIKVVSEYMRTRFFDQGITELCDIMKVYTPPSTGSWCKGVEFFKDEIVEYETPDN